MNATGVGRCFGAGLAPQGERVPFALGDRLILWPGSSRERPVPYDAIRLEPGGFDRRHIQLTWTEDGAPWALVLDDARLARAVPADPPPGLRGEVERLDARLKRGRLVSGAG